MRDGLLTNRCSSLARARVEGGMAENEAAGDEGLDADRKGANMEKPDEAASSRTHCCNQSLGKPSTKHLRRVKEKW